MAKINKYGEFLFHSSRMKYIGSNMWITIYTKGIQFKYHFINKDRKHGLQVLD